jgi:hypothetical protein
MALKLRRDREVTGTRRHRCQTLPGSTANRAARFKFTHSTSAIVSAWVAVAGSPTRGGSVTATTLDQLDLMKF